MSPSTYLELHPHPIPLPAHKMNSRALVFQSDVTSAVCGSNATSTIQEQDAVPIADVASSLLSRALSEL